MLLRLLELLGDRGLTETAEATIDATVAEESREEFSRVAEQFRIAAPPAGARQADEAGLRRTTRSFRFFPGFTSLLSSSPMRRRPPSRTIVAFLSHASSPLHSIVTV